MNALALIKRDNNTAPAAIDLQAMLLALQRYGQPRLGVYSSDGLWHCTVEMNTTGAGVTFKAASDFNHRTPIEAATVCRDRIQAALASIGKGLL